MEAAADLLGGGAVNLGSDGATRDRVDTNKVGGVGLSVGQGAEGNDVVLATGAQVVDLANIEGSLDSLAGSDSLESLLTESGSRNTETDAVKLKLAV